MVQIIKVTPIFSVAPQIAPADLAAIAAEGFRTVLNVRPDNEQPGQASGQEIETEARRLGLDYDYIPVVANAISDADIAKFEAVIAERQGPVFCYCRSGTRAIILWALAEAARQEPFAILKTADAAGYDISGFMTRIEQRRSAR